MKKYSFILLILFVLQLSAQEKIRTDTLSFFFEGKKRTGLLETPSDKNPFGLILLIPGSGKTNMLAENGYYKQLCSFFVGEGFACFVWDKPGCGKSEGEFDGDPSVQTSAREAITAIEELKQMNIPGSDKIGLWGLSRGGWVCPQIIASYPSISFWISVSGPDSEETFGYLLEKNWLIEGRSKKEAKKLLRAWQNNFDIARHGGTWEENQKATEILRTDPFYMYLTKNNSKPTKENYLKWQENLQNGKDLPVNEKTGLKVYFPGMDTVLGKINCPVLAIFGEKDSQVNWRKTMKLYKHSLGKKPGATLTVKTFPDGNHNLFKCKTGGFREKLDKIEFCNGYFESMALWLKERETTTK
jgi:pimeloyl-ACP methyl ester carboxylesterase